METKDNILGMLNDSLASNEEQIRLVNIDIKFLSHNDYKNKLALQRTLSRLDMEKRSILKDIYMIDRDTRLKDRELEAKVTKYEAEANYLDKQRGLDKVAQIMAEISGLPRGLADKKSEAEAEDKD